MTTSETRYCSQCDVRMTHWQGVIDLLNGARGWLCDECAPRDRSQALAWGYQLAGTSTDGH